MSHAKKKKSKEPEIHIHMAPQFEARLKKAEAQIEDLQNLIWEYRRNERHYKDAVAALLHIINNKQMRTQEPAK
jgi:hypothetical protein